MAESVTGPALVVTSGSGWAKVMVWAVAVAPVTVTAMVSSSASAGLPLSVTTTRKDWLPTWAAVGVQLKAPAAVMAAPAGTVPAGVVPTASVPARLNVNVWPASASVAVAVKASAWPTVALWLPTVASTGAWLVAVGWSQLTATLRKVGVAEGCVLLKSARYWM